MNFHTKNQTSQWDPSFREIDALAKAIVRTYGSLKVGRIVRVKVPGSGRSVIAQYQERDGECGSFVTLVGTTIEPTSYRFLGEEEIKSSLYEKGPLPIPRNAR